MLFGKRDRRIRRILIVEDEPLVAFDNENMLQDADYEVVATVDSYADAAAQIAAEQIDLVMTDISLAGEGDGLDVARAAVAKGVPVLIVTGNCSEEARGLAVGCLAKPYSEKRAARRARRGRRASPGQDREEAARAAGALHRGLILPRISGRGFQEIARSIASWKWRMPVSSVPSVSASSEPEARPLWPSAAAR